MGQALKRTGMDKSYTDFTRNDRSSNAGLVVRNYFRMDSGACCPYRS